MKNSVGIQFHFLSRLLVIPWLLFNVAEGHLSLQQTSHHLGVLHWALSAASPGGFCEAVWWPCSGWGLQSRREREHPDCGPQRGWNIDLLIAFKTTRCVRVQEEKFRYHIINPQPSVGFKGQKQCLKMDVKGLIGASSGHCCPTRARRSRISSVPCPRWPPPGFDPNLPGLDKLSQSCYTPRGGDLDYYY